MVASDVVKSSNPNLEKVKSQTGPTSSIIENQSVDEQELNNEESDLYYYSTEDKMYRVFNP